MKTGEKELRLPEEDLELFFKLYPALLFYANQRLNVVEGFSQLDGFDGLSLEEKVEIRDALCEKPAIIESFVAENPFIFTQDELEIVSGWRHLVRGTFYLVRYLKRYAVFLDEKANRAYGVVALEDAFEEILGPELPVRLEAMLIPFKGRIVYDGFLHYYNIFFGRGFREDLNEDYQEAKHRYGIITSLPPTGEEEKSDEEQLRFYLRNERSRMRYGEEIERLISKDSNLLRVYHREMGKIDARRYGRQLRGMGFKRGWFAILEGIIVAGGASLEQVEQALANILPAEKRGLPYIFQLRKSG